MVFIPRIKALRLLRTFAGTILPLVAVASIACSGDSVGPGDSGPVGTWELRTMDGKSLPVTTFTLGSTFRTELVRLTLVLYTNGNVTASATWRETDNGRVTTETEAGTGNWSQANASIAVSLDGDTATGAIAGGVMTLSFDAVVMVFRRQ